jgi:hypothetical protein
MPPPSSSEHTADIAPAPRPAKAFAGNGVYALTIVLSAFLLFQLQPVMGRMVLPWFGGSAAVWVTCMLFFQALLLLGYLYAHGLVTRVAPSRQKLVHVLVLAASIAVLPLSASTQWKPIDGSDPTLRILALLFASAGLPYFALATTSPLLQAWFVRTRGGEVPYRLFALSNLGSMAGLLSYPLLIEPTLTLRQQSLIWSCGYALFALLCAALAWRAGGAPSAAIARETSAHAGAGTNLRWIALAFLPSALLLAVTTHLTQNVAPIPLLWVLPLALYLLSFILCFESTRWYRRGVWLPLLVVALASMAGALLDNGRLLGLAWMIPLFCGGLFTVAMVCHGELAALKPAPALLTRFYLLIAFGGMLGGLFVGIAAPHLFPAYYELPLLLLVTPVMIWVLRRGDSQAWSNRARWRQGAIAVALLGLAVALAWRPAVVIQESRAMMRNFYGALRTKDWVGDTERRRSLHHGRIIHGMQFIGDARRLWPTTYYASNSGMGIAMLETERPGRRIGVIGLGTGTLAAYARAGDTLEFYEIDPNVLDLAQHEFTYLADTPAKIQHSIGDGRLVLERQAPQQFDVLVMDAFSGDAVPLHLLTREAFQLYSRHLKQDGLLVVNVSNRYVNLAPVVKRAAQTIGMDARLVETWGDAARVYYGASWVLATRSSEFFARERLKNAKPIVSNLAIWTDDYSSLFSVLKW